MDTVDGTNADADVTSTRIEATERNFMILWGGEVSLVVMLL
jgi:hypothetical protein